MPRRPAAAANCVDWANGNAIGGIASYGIGDLGVNSVVSLCGIAVPAADLATLDPDQEYFFANLVINHAKTVGTGACGGCNQPVCIALDYVGLTSPVAANDIKLQNGAFGDGCCVARLQSVKDDKGVLG